MKKNKIASCEGRQQTLIEHNKRTLMNTNVTQQKTSMINNLTQQWGVEEHQ